MTKRVSSMMMSEDDESQRFSMLSDKAILLRMKEGSVVIHPYKQENLNTSSYDVTLGKYYFRETPAEPGLGVYNPFDEEMVQRVWGQQCEAEYAREWTKRTGITLNGISGDDQIIWLAPGETILGHTEEFIGGRKTVTTMMKARSSLGRNFITLCRCAGWGDIGYINRWTMEITNNSRHYSIPLVVGRRVAQIVFFDSEGTLNTSYEKEGKYQSSSSLQELISSWTPSSVVPKMYRDREVVPGSNTRTVEPNNSQSNQ